MVSHQEIEEITLLERITLKAETCEHILPKREKCWNLPFSFFYHDETLHHKHVVFQANK